MDWNGYDSHGDAFRMSLNGLLVSTQNGVQAHAFVFSTSDYAQWLTGIQATQSYAQLGNEDAVKALEDNPYAEILEYDPSGPYTSASIRIDGTAGAFFSTPPILEDRGDYLLVEIPTFMIAPDLEEGWVQNMRSFLAASSSADKAIIIDLRGNSGGLPALWIAGIVQPLLKQSVGHTFNFLYKDSALVHRFARYANAELRPISEFKGKFAFPEELSSFAYFSEERMQYEPLEVPIEHGRIYLIQDNSSFSASDAFLSWAKATGFARIVGSTRSRGDGILHAPLLFKLPHSGFVVDMSWCCGLNPDGTINAEVGTSPDILVMPGKDPIDAILEDLRASAPAP